MQQTEKRTKGTVIVNQLSAIHRLEQKQGIRNSRKGEEDIQNYIRMKLLLRRFDFDLPENYEKEVYEYIIKNHISDCMLVYLVTKNMFHRQKVVTRLTICLNRQMIESGQIIIREYWLASGKRRE